MSVPIIQQQQAATSPTGTASPTGPSTSPSATKSAATKSASANTYTSTAVKSPFSKSIGDFKAEYEQQRQAESNEPAPKAPDPSTQQSGGGGCSLGKIFGG